MTGLPRTTTVRELLERRAAATPDAPAFYVEAAPCRWQALSWRSFAEQVAMLRRALWASGLRPGDRLALIAAVSLRWELLHHAALSMGVVVVGLDAHDVPERLAAMTAAAGVNAYAVSEPRTLAAFGVDRLTAARWVLSVGVEHPPLAGGTRVLDWNALETAGSGLHDEAPRPIGDDLATIIFTSGTTGAPKGIAYRHQQVCLAIDAIGSAFEFVGPGGRLLCWLPLSNLFQRIVNLAAVRNGAATYLLGDPRRIMEVVASVEPDIFVGVPRFFEKLRDGILLNLQARPAWMRVLVETAWRVGRRASRVRLAGRSPGVALRTAVALADRMVLRRIRSVMGSRLRCFASGSAPLSLHLLAELDALGWTVLEAYGLSENILPMAMNRIDDYRYGTVGKPVDGNDVVVRDGGTIAVRGAGVFDGYLGDPGPPPFDAQGYYVTGDLGRLDSHGYLTLTGRSGDLIKTSTGRRIAPAAVESQLREVQGVDQALLVGEGRKYPVAVVTTSLSAAAVGDWDRLEQGLRERMPRINGSERPRGIAIVGRPFSIEAGELTTNLKLRRQVIEQRHADLVTRLYDAIDGQQAPRDVLFVLRAPRYDNGPDIGVDRAAVPACAAGRAV